MTIRRSIIGFMGGFMLFLMGLSYAQTYPTKPIRILTSQPGGAGDVALRLIAPALSQRLGQPIVIDNRASSVLSAQAIAQAPADGYTLTVYGTTLWTGPLVQPSGYDAERDFAPISIVTQSPSILVISPLVAANSVKELIALAKAKPGTLNYSSGNAGSLSQLAMELFKSMAGVNIVRIPYKGAGPALNAVAAGETQVMIANIDALPNVQAGRMKALAVTSAKPSILLPNLPTVAASGLPGYEMVGMLGMLTTAKTPVAIINQLNREVVSILKQPETKERLLTFGTEPVGSSPSAFAAEIKSELQRMRTLIKVAGIHVE
jgi:tripartite-type tricarboxylate transporter receptor subunit TctC